MGWVKNFPNTFLSGPYNWSNFIATAKKSIEQPPQTDTYVFFTFQQKDGDSNDPVVVVAVLMTQQSEMRAKLYYYDGIDGGSNRMANVM